MSNGASTEDSLMPGRFLYKWFKTAGDSVEMNVLGTSGSPIDFFFVSDNTGTKKIARINVVAVMNAIKYGQFLGIASALTNGIEVKVFNDEDVEVLDYNDGINIKTTEDFTPLSGVDATTFAAAGPDLLPVRFTIRNSGHPMLLPAAWYMRVRIQDDTRTVAKLRMQIQGTIW